MSHRLRLVAAGSLVTVMAIAAAAAQPTSPRRDSTASPPTGKHLVWKVARAGRTTAFLVGSVHVLSKDVYPLPPLFDRVFEQTASLIEEVDLGETGDASAVMATAMQAVFTDGQTLESVLDAKVYARVTEKAEAAGLPMLVVDRMKPWLVAVTLSVPDLQRAGFDPAYGLDRHFYDRAKKAARPVRGLETAAYQIDRMNGLSLPVQVEMLKAMLDDVDTQVGGVKDIVAGWRAGDVAALERLLLKEFRESPEVYQRLIVERNKNWVPAITECRAEAPCLVVVGGAHLLGGDGLVALLAREGFTVEQQ